MVNVVHHITSCCGAGKSRFTINQLYHDMVQGKIPERTVVVASKSKLLLEQNETIFNEARALPAQRNILCRRIDDTTVHRVFPELSLALEKKFEGVLFITHAALAMVSSELFSGVRIIIDEVPGELVKHHSFGHSITNNPPEWSSWLTAGGKPFDNSQTNVQQIDPPSVLARPLLQEHVENVRKLGNKGINKNNAADFIDFLLIGHGKAYTNASTDNTIRFYNAICDQQLVGLIQHASHITILSAQLKETVIGFILQHVMKISILETSMAGGIRLPRKHRKRIKLIPFLKEGSWSKGVKGDKASKMLVLAGSRVNSSMTCGELAQEFSGNQIPNDDFLLIYNRGDELIQSIKPRASAITNQVHGMNSFMHLHHAAYVATSIPSPHEYDAFNRYLNDNGVFHLTINDTMKTERCYESAYQCIARTSLRNAANITPDHTIVVPDKGYAEYIASWFDQGYVAHHHQHSYTRHDRDSKRKTDHEWLEILRRILRDEAAGIGSITSLCEREGISRRTFYNKLKQFGPKLTAEGFNLDTINKIAKTDTKTAA